METAGVSSGIKNTFSCSEYFTDKDWRCGKYGPLGLIETVLKLIAIGVGIGSIALYDPDENRIPRLTIARSCQIAIFILLSLLNLAWIVQRVMEKELCAIVFGVFQSAAHIVLTVVLFTSGDPSEFVFLFVVLQMWGDYAKIAFIYIEDEFEVYLLDRPKLFVITAISIFIYIVLLLLQIVVWYLDFPIIS